MAAEASGSTIRRIRIHAVPPAADQETRAWVQFDVSEHPTIAHCRTAFAKQLGIDSKGLRLSLDGFQLLDGLSSGTLNPDRDILELSKATSTTDPTHDRSKAKRRKIHDSKQDVQGEPAVAAQTAAAALSSHKRQANAVQPRRSASATSQSQKIATSNLASMSSLPVNPSNHASSSSSSSTSSSSSSSSSTSSSSDSSESSDESMDISSESSSDPSSSSSDSDSSDSGEDSSSAPSEQPIAKALTPAPQPSLDEPVTPGEGKTQTQTRNARKRKRARMLRQAERELSKQNGVFRPDDAAAKKVLKQERTQSDSVSLVRPVQTTPRMSTPVLDASTAIRQPQPEVSVIQPVASATMQVPNTSDSHQIDATQMLKSLGNGHKAKALRRDLAKSGQLRKGQQKIVFDEDPLGQAGASLTSVPTALQSTNQGVAPAAAVPAGTTPFGASHASAIARRPPPPPPSTRSDLPSNVIVTSVDVEREDWVAGEHTKNFEAPVQVPHYARFGANATADSSLASVAEASMYKSGSGKKNKKRPVPPSGPTPFAYPASAPIISSTSSLSAALGEWHGWPSKQAIEAGFDGWRKVTAPDEGEKVAVKILELSPASYMPELATYYGIVLTLESTPDGSSSIKLKLHPDSRINGQVEEAEEEAYETGWEAESGLRRPRKFGQDMLDGVEQSVDDSEKEIKLDDIIDCRRVHLL